MQAIVVKWYGPTANKGTRIKAYCQAKTMWLSQEWIDSQCTIRKIPISNDNRAKVAAEELRYALGWHSNYYGHLEMGNLPNGDYVFVFTGNGMNG